MAVSRNPALVGAPPVDTGARVGDELEVEEAELRLVVRRALGNYLSRTAANLRADLDSAVVIALPTTRLRILSVESTTWVRPGRVAVVLKAAGAGSTWTLRYELDVVKRDRWYVRAIQTNPTQRRSP